MEFSSSSDDDELEYASSTSLNHSFVRRLFHPKLATVPMPLCLPLVARYSGGDGCLWLLGSTPAGLSSLPFATVVRCTDVEGFPGSEQVPDGCRI